MIEEANFWRVFNIIMGQGISAWIQDWVKQDGCSWASFVLWSSQPMDEEENYICNCRHAWFHLCFFIHHIFPVQGHDL